MSTKYARVGTDLVSLAGRVVRVVITCEPDGSERLTVSGVNCDLDGDEPGSYVLVTSDVPNAIG